MKNENFVTIFDSNFLPQGLNLYYSIKRHIHFFKLWILCVDDEVFETLSNMNLKHINLLKLSLLETESLKNIKLSRTRAEYCWTLTPFSIKFVFEKDQSIDRVTYLDADLYFIKNPELIFKEFDESGKGVLITDHDYAPEYDESEIVGKFCVQFMIFKKYEGEFVRKWWEKKCLDWCYAYFDNGRFGDQKYLDEWPIIFNKIVHVLNIKGLALAPWNAKKFPWDTGIFYHFHSLKIISTELINIGHYKIPKVIFENIYKPYFVDLREAEELINKYGKKLPKQAKKTSLIKKIWRTLKAFNRLFENYLLFEIRKW